jgi:hypothetical protein
MKCDKCVGMECLELHMLHLLTPRPDILRMKSGALTVTLHAKDVTKLPNRSYCLFIYSIMMCMITQITAVCCTEQGFYVFTYYYHAYSCISIWFTKGKLIAMRGQAGCIILFFILKYVLND